MRISGKKTRYPGGFKIDEMNYRIRAVGTDPRTGKRRQVERVLEGVTAQDAARKRSEMQAEIAVGKVDGAGARLRVWDYARSWIESKARGIDPGTAKRYVTALELHILSVLGDYYLDALAPMVVQEWLNGALRKAVPGTRRPDDGETVFGWWKVVRTMLRDAVEQWAYRVIPRGGSPCPSWRRRRATPSPSRS